MHLIGLALLLQIACAVHCVRTLAELRAG